MAVDLILRNARLITMEPGRRTLEGRDLAVEGGRIAALGGRAELEPLVGPKTRILDLAGKTVLPGFIDTHVHLLQTGLGLRGPDLAPCRKVEEVLELASQAVRDQAGEGCVFLQKCRLAALDRPLEGRDLDRIAPVRPLVVGDFELHGCVANGPALARARETGVDLAGADPASGRLTGPAHTAFRRYCYDTFDPELIREALEAASEKALRAGVTTVHAIEGRVAFGARSMDIIASLRDDLPVRTVLFHQAEEPERARELGVKGIADLWADGSYIDRSAALLAPYADRPGEKGRLFYDPERMIELALAIHEQGLQVSFHAVGDAAIEQVLDVYAQAGKREPSFRQALPRIEHFSLANRDQVLRAAELGVAVAMQPALSAGPQETVARRLGPERAGNRHPYRWIMEAGLLVAGGSDSDVTPIDPLAGIQATASQEAELRRLSVREALALFTLNGALIAGQEKSKGTLEPGKLADLIVLGQDPLETPPRRVGRIPVEMTLVGGEVRWSGPGREPGQGTGRD